MPFQVLNDPSRSAVSDSIGNALSVGLQNLVSHKLNAMQQQRQQQQTMQGLQALGYNSQQAAQLSNLDPQSLQQVVKQKLAEPGERAYANALGAILGEQQQNIAPVAQQQPKQGPSISDAQKLQLRKYLASPKAQKAYKPEDIKRLESFLERPEPVMQPEQAPQVQAPVLGGLNAKQATEIAKLKLEKQKISSKERSEAFKETKALREELRAKKNSAKAKLEDLDRMEELEKEGKLDTPGYLEFLNRAGLDIPSLMDEGSQEFNKIATNFIRDAKEYFGGRISNFEIEQFLKTVPSLSQSPEGRKRVIANLRRIEQMGVATYDAYKEVLKENNGIPPLDLGEQVDEKLEKKRDAITKRFKQDLSRPVPEGQNKLITAAQASLGSIISAPGKILKGLGGGLGNIVGLL